MLSESLFNELDANFDGKDLKTVNDMEREVHKHLRKISKEFLAIKLQDQIKSKENNLKELDKELKTENNQKKSKNNLW